MELAASSEGSSVQGNFYDSVFLDFVLLISGTCSFCLMAKGTKFKLSKECAGVLSTITC